ncbi:MAG TPA: 50S ribosomal protein L18 [Thermomicrobiales bacterium]|nr:50S ribosomal protein L18 [Thermomicrobiales bacterium]
MAQGKFVKRLSPRQVRHRRVRKRVSGTPQRLRLNVFRSSAQIYAQIIDDTRGHTLVAASSIDAELRGPLAGKSKVEKSQAVGDAIARRARDAGITRVVFDRGGYLYHGRVKAVADAARAAGLEF